MDRRELLSQYSKDELIDLLGIYAKNFLALDGTWFQSVEAREGMDAAMYHDGEAWRRYTVSEARRLKAFLGLGEHPGLEGLERALKLRLCANAHPEVEVRREGDAIICTVVRCRVQEARARKNMPWHPCKPVGQIEYGGFAKAIDERIDCACLSCYPEVTDPNCGCSWLFTLREEEDACD